MEGHASRELKASARKPPRVPGLVTQPLPNSSSSSPHKNSSKNTTLFIDLSPRSRANTNSPRVQGAPDSTEWDDGLSTGGASDASVSTRGSWASSTAAQKSSTTAIAGESGPPVMKSRTPAGAQIGRGLDSKGSNAQILPASDTDSEWVPLRESKDFNAQLRNCYEGLKALQVRCGYINKKLSLKAQQITLSLNTRTEAVKQQLSLGTSRRREIDDEIKALEDDSPVEQDLEDVLTPMLKELEEAEAAKQKHEAAVEQVRGDLAMLAHGVQ